MGLTLGLVKFGGLWNYLALGLFVIGGTSRHEHKQRETNQYPADAGRSPKSPALTHRPDTEESATQATPCRTRGYPRHPIREPQTAAKPPTKHNQRPPMTLRAQQAHSAPTIRDSPRHTPNAATYADP
jgi:hypothetical protein